MINFHSNRRFVAQLPTFNELFFMHKKLHRIRNEVLFVTRIAFTSISSMINSLHCFTWNRQVHSKRFDTFFFLLLNITIQFEQNANNVAKLIFKLVVSVEKFPFFFFFPADPCEHNNNKIVNVY